MTRGNSSPVASAADEGGPESQAKLPSAVGSPAIHESVQFDFMPGQRVRAHGLQKNPSMNGQTSKFMGWIEDDPGWCIIHFDNGERNQLRAVNLVGLDGEAAASSALQASIAAAAKARRRVMLMGFVGVGGACLSLRVLATNLLVRWGGGGGEELLQCIQMLLLYHPSRYEDDMDYQQQIGRFQAIAKQKISYRLDTVHYSLQEFWAGDRGKTGDNQQAFLIHPDGPATGGLWVLFGGNAMLATDWLHFCWELLLLDGAPRPAFLLVDYPGYGANDGSPSPRKVLISTLAAIRSAHSLLVSPKPEELHLLGHSLGSSAATQLAACFEMEVEKASSDDALSQLRPGHLVLSAPFTSMEDMAQLLLAPGNCMMPLWMVRPLVSHKWNSKIWISQAAACGWNIGIIHGTNDMLVPHSMGRALENAAQQAIQKAPVETRGRVKFLEFRSAGHNDVLDHVKEYAKLMGLIPNATMPQMPHVRTDAPIATLETFVK